MLDKGMAYLIENKMNKERKNPRHMSSRQHTVLTDMCVECETESISKNKSINTGKRDCDYVKEQADVRNNLISEVDFKILDEKKPK